LDHFIHKVYIHAARKVYMNVYLFEKNVSPLQIQKNNRELDSIIQECILTTIRESIPTEAIIRAYMDESVEQEEEVFIENVKEPVLETESSTPTEESKKSEEEEPAPVVPSVKNVDEEPAVTRLTFNDVDSVLNGSDNVEAVVAPKTIERLEEISTSRAIQRKLEEEADEDEDRIKIHTDALDLSSLDILDLDPSKPANSMVDDLPIFDFEELN